MRYIILIILFVIPSYGYSGIPMNITHSNITDKSFTISWVSSAAEKGYIIYGTNSEISYTEYDDRGKDTVSYVHHITVNNPELSENTICWYVIVSGNEYYNTCTITTAPAIAPPVDSDLIYGKIYQQDNIPADAIVYIRIYDMDGKQSSGYSSLGSAFTDNNGTWFFNLINLRTSKLTNSFRYSSKNDIVYVYVEGGKQGIINHAVKTDNDSPYPDMILTQDITPPYISYLNPQPEQKNIPKDINIIVHIKDDAAGIDKNSIIMKVNDHHVSFNITGCPAEYRLVYNPDEDFEYNETVKVLINAGNIKAQTMGTKTYVFYIESNGSDNNGTITSIEIDFPYEENEHIRTDMPISFAVRYTNLEIKPQDIIVKLDNIIMPYTVRQIPQGYHISLNILKYDIPVYHKPVTVVIEIGDKYSFTQKLIISSPAPSVREVKVYPNPWKPDIGCDRIYFAPLPEMTHIRIFDISGEQIIERMLKFKGIWMWNMKDEEGRDVAPGLYIYLVKDKTRYTTATGKILIIR